MARETGRDVPAEYLGGSPQAAPLGQQNEPAQPLEPGNVGLSKPLGVEKSRNLVEREHTVKQGPAALRIPGTWAAEPEGGEHTDASGKARSMASLGDASDGLEIPPVADRLGHLRPQRGGATRYCPQPFHVRRQPPLDSRRRLPARR